MLTTYLNSLPYSKFILIEDSVATKGVDVLQSLVQNHEKKQDYRTHFFAFERNFSRVKNERPLSVCHDFSSDLRNWVLSNGTDFKTVISNLNDSCVIVVDSLTHVLYRYGLSEAYQIFAELKNKSNVHQIITILHTDLLKERDKVSLCFQHLATLSLNFDNNRISYVYKKSQRKIIKQIEEFHFENGRLVTQQIKKPNKEIIQEAIENIIPENLSTFKISLSEKDKESREKLILPYLPKENDSSDSKIHYSFDDIDDWDEEDPDDDLDI